MTRKQPRRRKATNPDSLQSSLSPQQEAAIDLLAVGRNVTDVASEIGVARQTVSQWLNRDDDFRAALNVRRSELWQGTSDRLRSLLPKALDAIEGRLDAEDALAAAVHVLKAEGLYGLPVEIGATEGEKYELTAWNVRPICDRGGSCRRSSDHRSPSRAELEFGFST